MIRFTDFGLQQLSRQAQMSGSETLYCSTTLTAKGCCGPGTSFLLCQLDHLAEWRVVMSTRVLRGSADLAAGQVHNCAHFGARHGAFGVSCWWCSDSLWLFETVNP